MKGCTSFLMCCNAPKEGIAGECGYGCKPGWPVAPNRRDNVEMVEIAAWGGAPAGAQSYNRCAESASLFSAGGGVDFAITIDLTEQQLGRCPKPHKGRCPLTLQGTLSLDPFARLS